MNTAPMMAIKVDVDTYRGTKEGVVRLLAIFNLLKVHATFLFSLGPDRTGLAIRRLWQRGFLRKVSRIPLVKAYGLKTLLYGTLLPAPDIGRLSGVMRQVRDAGHQVGVHVYDHVSWQDHVRHQSAAWTQHHMMCAVAAFERIFGEKPVVHGAAGWQMNVHALRCLGKLGFSYASDTRGHAPFWPVYRGEPIGVLQLPTTLPTLDELMVDQRVVADSGLVVRLVEILRHRTADVRDHVYTAHAELEGGIYQEVLTGVLTAWRRQGYHLGSLEDLYRKARKGYDADFCVVEDLPCPGRSYRVMTQGASFPGSLRTIGDRYG